MIRTEFLYCYWINTFLALIIYQPLNSLTFFTVIYHRLESYEILIKYKPQENIFPSILDFTDCPYSWPFYQQPLYAGAMSVIFNATILNGMGVIGHVESEQLWKPFDEVGNLLSIHFTYSNVISPWTIYLALHMQIKYLGHGPVTLQNLKFIVPPFVEFERTRKFEVSGLNTVPY